MSMVAQPEWSPDQQRRLDEFGVTRSVDIHCHCLPGLDDGPRTVDEAVALCQALVNDGITSVVATPHQLGRYDRTNSAERVRAAVEELSAELKDREIPLEIFPGGDVRVDERLPELVQAGDVCTVADAGQYLLLELPHEIFIDALPIIDRLANIGVQTILTHPERHPYLRSRSQWLRDCLKHGVLLQITAGSLLGDFGAPAREDSLRMIDAGMVGIVASDAHNEWRRPPRMSPAIQLLNSSIGRVATRRLALENPLRVLEGRAVELE
jgi:protein-tyrosine phosphatase